MLTTPFYHHLPPAFTVFCWPATIQLAGTTSCECQTLVTGGSDDYDSDDYGSDNYGSDDHQGYSRCDRGANLTAN